MSIPDPRQYDVAATSPGSSGFTPITNPGNSYYAQVIKSTPGLMNWWRLGKTFATWGTTSPNPPFWSNSAGAASLWSPNGSALGSGLITGDADGAAVLTTSRYLEAFDYRAMSSTGEILSAECWVNLSNLGTDTALIGEWQSNVGWMIYNAAGTLKLYVAGSHIDAPSPIVTGTLYHVVGVWGGQQSPTPDYLSRLYVNGIEVVNGLMPLASGSIDTFATRFQVNQYGSAGGTGLAAGTWDEIALYTRMLQPDEIAQHYNAGLGLTWP